MGALVGAPGPVACLAVHPRGRSLGGGGAILVHQRVELGPRDPECSGDGILVGVGRLRAGCRAIGLEGGLDDGRAEPELAGELRDRRLGATLAALRGVLLMIAVSFATVVPSAVATASRCAVVGRWPLAGRFALKAALTVAMSTPSSVAMAANGGW